jgi:hypothetical protein
MVVVAVSKEEQGANKVVDPVDFKKRFNRDAATKATRFSPYTSYPLVVFLKGQPDKLKTV